MPFPRRWHRLSYRDTNLQTVMHAVNPATQVHGTFKSCNIRTPGVYLWRSTTKTSQYFHLLQECRKCPR